MVGSQGAPDDGRSEARRAPPIDSRGLGRRLRSPAGAAPVRSRASSIVDSLVNGFGRTARQPRRPPDCGMWHPPARSAARPAAGRRPSRYAPPARTPLRRGPSRPAGRAGRGAPRLPGLSTGPAAFAGSHPGPSSAAPARWPSCEAAAQCRSPPCRPRLRTAGTAWMGPSPGSRISSACLPSARWAQPRRHGADGGPRGRGGAAALKLSHK